MHKKTFAEDKSCIQSAIKVFKVLSLETEGVGRRQDKFAEERYALAEPTVLLDIRTYA